MTSFKILKEFQDDELKKKWKYYIIGITLYFIFASAITLTNYLNDPNLRLIVNLFGLSTICNIYFVYYGVGRQID